MSSRGNDETGGIQAHLTLFYEDRGRYRLRPGVLNSYRWACQTLHPDMDPPAVPGAAYISTLRRGLDTRRLQDCGYEGDVADIADAALAVAIMGGIVTNAAFLDIVDDLLVRSSCLCCYYARSHSRAAEAESQICLLRTYYNQASYEASSAFYRTLCGLLRDISASEADMISHHKSGRHGDGPESEQAARDGVAALNRLRGVCAVYIDHVSTGGGWTEAGILTSAGTALCVYSTPEGRKLLRRLGKKCKAAGLTLTTRVATSSSYEFFCLRYKRRLYALECHASEPPTVDGSAPIDIFWRCVAVVTKRR